MADDELPDDDHDAKVKAMHDKHVDVARKAVDIAMRVLDAIDPDDVTAAVAVQLLKFGVESERKALLGVEPDEDVDPFADLEKAAAESGKAS